MGDWARNLNEHVPWRWKEATQGLTRNGSRSKWDMCSLHGNVCNMDAWAATAYWVTGTSSNPNQIQFLNHCKHFHQTCSLFIWCGPFHSKLSVVPRAFRFPARELWLKTQSKSQETTGNWWFLGLNAIGPYNVHSTGMQQSGGNTHPESIYLVSHPGVHVREQRSGVTGHILSIWCSNMNLPPIKLHTKFRLHNSQNSPNLTSQKQSTKTLVFFSMNPQAIHKQQVVKWIEASDFGKPLKPGQTSSLGVPSFWKIWSRKEPRWPKRKGEAKHNHVVTTTTLEDYGNGSYKSPI